LIAPDLKYLGDWVVVGKILGEYCVCILRSYLKAVGLLACFICSAASHLYLGSM
jgi:hypothetical protein